MTSKSFNILAALLFCVLLSSCNSVPKERQLYNGEDYLYGRWAIHSFNGFDPYPAASSAAIDAFVDFGLGDGLMRFSIGCGVFSTPYQVNDEARIEFPKETTLVLPDTSKLMCADNVKQLNDKLLVFMQSSPSVGLEPGYMLTLRSGRDALQLNSVEFVLSN